MSKVVTDRYPNASEQEREDLGSAVEKALTRALDRHGKAGANLTLTQNRYGKKGHEWRIGESSVRSGTERSQPS